MDIYSINPDELPDGHPLKDVIIKAKKAISELHQVTEKDDDSRNNLLFDEINELRDLAKDEQEFCRAIHAVVETIDAATDMIGGMRFEIRTRLLRMVAKTLLNKADGFDSIMSKSAEVKAKLERELAEGDVEPES